MIPRKEHFHVYLLMGQSNMAGRGKLPAERPAPNPRILALDKNDEWTVAIEPLHFDKASAGVGLGMSFATAMLETSNEHSMVARTACVDSIGLDHKGDATHFHGEALVEFGKRYATAMCGLYTSSR